MTGFQEKNRGINPGTPPLGDTSLLCPGLDGCPLNGGSTVLHSVTLSVLNFAVK